MAKEKLTSEKVPLQMLRVEISLGTMRARKLAIRVLLGDHGVLRGAGTRRSRRPTRGTGEDTATSLRSNYMSWLVTILHHTLLVRHHWTAAVWRRQALLGHDTASRHGTEDGGSRGRRSWRNRLRMRGSNGGLRHHGRRRRIALVRLLRIRIRDPRTSTSRLVGRRRVITHGLRLGSMRIRCTRTRSPRRVGIAVVDVLHSGMLRLQRWQSVRRERTLL